MSESPRFDHLLHCVPDVPRAVGDYTAAGLPAHVNPPHRGMRNGRGGSTPGTSRS